MTIDWKSVEQYFNVVLFVFQFSQFVILENLSIFDLALSRLKGCMDRSNNRASETPQCSHQGFYLDVKIQ